jgi:hypothetical protein
MVNIDTVYQTVLAIANKEQRGYITPQEFNLFANQAQMEIFEQYFYDKNQFSKIPGNSTEHSDMLDLLKEKISIFKRSLNVPISNTTGKGMLPLGIYRLGNVFNQAYGNYKLEQIDESELKNIENSIIAPTQENPVFVTSGGGANTYNNIITVYPVGPFAFVKVTYVRRPSVVNWGYNVVDEHALHDITTSQDFELHGSEETSLIMKILSLAGIALKDTTLYQVGEATEVKKIQQEKQ